MFEPCISLFGDKFYDKNGMNWHPNLYKNPEMLLNDLE